jgi:hypothetical protein
MPPGVPVQRGLLVLPYTGDSLMGLFFMTASLRIAIAMCALRAMPILPALASSQTIALTFDDGPNMADPVGLSPADAMRRSQIIWLQPISSPFSLLHESMRIRKEMS